MSETRPQIAQEPRNTDPAPVTPDHTRQAATDALRAQDGPSERLRRAADLVERRAVETAAEPWASPHVRATLVPWVALMTPDLAPHLAAWLHEAADQCARAYDDLTAEQGPVLAELLPAMTSDEAVAHVARLWRRPLALADVILRGETR